MDDFELEIKIDFLNEALMNLEAAESFFVALESSTDPENTLNEIFRIAHNLKGGSRAVGFGDVAEFTHHLESFVLKVKKQEIPLTAEIVTVLLKSNDRLVEMITALKADLAATFDNKDLLAEIAHYSEGGAAPAHATEAPAVVETETPVTSVPETVESSADDLTSSLDASIADAPSATAFFSAADEAAPAPVEAAPSAQVIREAAAPAPSASAKPSAQPPAALKEDEIIRVSLSRIDRLSDYIGELIVLQSVVQQQAENGETAKLLTAVRQMMKISKDIQSLSMGLRMLPVKPLVQKLQRVVRDTAKAVDKKVNFEIIGEQMEIDKSVLDRLVDPLIHILRNAIDHGLETTENRGKAGKFDTGNVTLAFMNQGNHLVVEVRDDGKGMNAQSLRRKAIEKGVITESQNLTEKQMINLIFAPGFSTKTETSEISGRGVGMDVVKTNVEKIGGNVEVQTVEGAGSTFKLQIPLSLAVIDGLVVAGSTGRFVIPLNQVQETVNLKSYKVHENKVGIGPCFELRGQVVPLWPLELALGNKRDSLQIDGTALLVNVQDRLVAVVVREILRAQQIVIKPLGNGITAQPGWVGSCVLGDGLPTLILSPVDLLNNKIISSIGEQPVQGKVA